MAHHPLVPAEKTLCITICNRAMWAPVPGERWKGALHHAANSFGLACLASLGLGPPRTFISLWPEQCNTAQHQGELVGAQGSLDSQGTCLGCVAVDKAQHRFGAVPGVAEAHEAHAGRTGRDQKHRAQAYVKRATPLAPLQPGHEHERCGCGHRTDVGQIQLRRITRVGRGHRQGS